MSRFGAAGILAQNDLPTLHGSAFVSCFRTCQQIPAVHASTLQLKCNTTIAAIATIAVATPATSGRVLSRLPLDVGIGKMLLLSLVFQAESDSGFSGYS